MSNESLIVGNGKCGGDDGGLGENKEVQSKINSLFKDNFSSQDGKVEKFRVELFNDMKEVTKQGLIHFEIYNEAGSLITILKNPADFNETIESSFNNSKMLIKSVSAVQLRLPSDFMLTY